jgi:ATP-dependent helicase/DNAse subunit B
VGSNLLGLYLRRLLVQRGISHINIRFLTFIDLARDFASESLAGQGLAPLPEFGEQVCISALVQGIAETSCFYPVAERKGFRRSLAGTFRDLRDAGIDGLPDRQEEKIGELGRLYRGYRERIDRGFYTDSDLLLKAARRADLFRDILGAREFILYGFYDFIPAQKELLRNCLPHLETTVFMPWRESPGFAYARPTLQWFKKSGFQIAIPAAPSMPAKTSLEFLQSGLFREKPGGKPAPEDGRVTVLSCPGEIQEIREIAREILRLAREEGLKFHEMAILLRNLELYRPLIREIFQDLGIPFHLHGGLPLARTQEGRALSLLLGLVGTPFRRSEVMEFLTFAPIAWPRFFKDPPSSSRWDHISRLAGIVEGRRQWEEKLASLTGGESAWGDEERSPFMSISGEEVQDLRSFLKGFFSALERFPREGSWKELSAAVAEMVERYFEAGPNREAILGILQKISALDVLGPAADLRTFQEILGNALEAESLRQGFFQKDGVLVADIMPARGLSFRAVFVPGLVERSFPAPPRQDPLLLDHEREALNESFAAAQSLALKRARLLEEKILFSLAAGSARERLFLSYARLDPSSGRERIPSFFLLNAGECLQGERMDYSLLERLRFFRKVPLSRYAPETEKEAVDENEFDLLQILKALKGGGRPAIAYLSGLFPGFARAEKMAKRRWGIRLFTEYDGCLGSARARRILQERFALSGQVLSATRLETYASCPFRYFLSEILNLQPVPSPEEIRRIEPLSRGTLLHKILHDFYRHAAAEIPLPLRPDRLASAWEIMEQTARRAFSEAEAKGETGLALLWELDRQSLLEDLKAFLKTEAELADDFIPRDFEIQFGFESKQGRPSRPFLLLEDNSEVFLRGRIDRVDGSAGGDILRIVDYKSGKIRGEEDGFGGGASLQLPLYLLAARQLWGRVNLEKSWAEYYSINREQNFKRVLFRGEGWEEKEKILKKIIGTIGRGIASGLFFPVQEDERKCRYCDFGRLCEQSTDVLFERKKNDPRARAYLEMRDIP